MKNALIYIAVICIMIVGGVANGIASKSELGTLKWFLSSSIGQIITIPAILWWINKLTKNQHGKDL